MYNSAVNLQGRPANFSFSHFEGTISISDMGERSDVKRTDSFLEKEVQKIIDGELSHSEVIRELSDNGRFSFKATIHDMNNLLSREGIEWPVEFRLKKYLSQAMQCDMSDYKVIRRRGYGVIGQDWEISASLKLAENFYERSSIRRELPYRCITRQAQVIADLKSEYFKFAEQIKAKDTELEALRAKVKLLEDDRLAQGAFDEKAQMATGESYRTDQDELVKQLLKKNGVNIVGKEKIIERQRLALSSVCEIHKSIMQKLICPIDLDPLDQEAVITPSGNTYKKANVLSYIEKTGNDPFFVPTTIEQVYPNRLIREIMPLVNDLDAALKKVEEKK